MFHEVKDVAECGEVDSDKSSLEEVEQRVVRQTLEALVTEGLVRVNQLAEEVFEICLGNRDIVCNGRRDAFRRFFIRSASEHSCEGTEFVLEDLTRALRVEFGPRVNQLVKELSLTAHFVTLSARTLGFTGSRRQMPYRRLEMLLHDGHPYHPCFKSRLGFSDKDHLNFSPEYEREIALQCLEVKNEFLVGCLSVTGSTTIWVHPWQWREMRDRPQVSELLARGYIQESDAKTMSCQATQSLRTLMPFSHGEEFHIKLPLSLTNSSSIRTLDHSSVLSAEAISGWIKSIVAKDEFLREQDVTILKEYGGVMINPEFGGAIEGCLGHLLRESPLKGRDSKQQLVPGMALSACEADGDLFIAPWLQQYGWQAWFRQLVKVVVLPLWHLLMRYGVGSEWHAQNMVLAFEKGWPVGLILRDFHDGVEYHEGSLPAGVAAPDFSGLDVSPDEAAGHYRVDTFDSVKDLVLECLFVYNLCELARVLVDQHALSEAELWQIVEEEIAQHCRQFPDLSARQIEHAEALKVIKVESLLAGKVKPKLQEGFYHHMESNPLKLELYV